MVTVNHATTSCPGLPACPGWQPPPAAAAPRCQQGPLRAGPTALGFPQPHRGCPCVPSVTHGAAMLGGAVTRGHGNTGLGTLPWSQHSFAWHSMAQQGLAQFGLVWLSPASLLAWPGMSSSAQPSPVAGKKLCIAILLVSGLNRVILMGVPNPGAPSHSLEPGEAVLIQTHCSSWHRAQASQGTFFLPHPTLPQEVNPS